MTWLAENISTIVICIILIAVVACIIMSMVRDKKKGKSSCGAGCASCALHGKCHKN